MGTYQGTCDMDHQAMQTCIEPAEARTENPGIRDLIDKEEGLLTVLALKE